MKPFYLLTLLLLTLTLSCERTIEGEQSAFDKNIWTLEELEVKYPKFKVACENLKNDATNQMESARKLVEEKSKIEGMSAANSIASPVWVVNLASLDNKIKAIQAKINQAVQISKEKNNATALTAAQIGEKAIKETKKNIVNAVVRNTSDAEAIVSNVVSILERSDRKLDDALEATKETKLNEIPIENVNQNSLEQENVNYEIDEAKQEVQAEVNQKQEDQNTFEINKYVVYGAVLLIFGLLASTLILVLRKK
jgi:hypothetical protein